MAQVAHERPAGALGPLIAEDWDALTFRVRRTAYRSPEIFQAEMRRIWATTWLYLGHVSELPKPGDFKTRVLGGRPLIFCRDSAGEIRAFFNSCPHRGTVLCRDNEGTSKRFQCFYHAWTFNNDGSVAAIPGEDAYPAETGFRDSMRLRALPRLEIHEGFVFVSFTPDVPPLLDHLGNAADYLSMAAQQCEAGMQVLPGAQLYTVRGNWKLAVENAMDGYHFAPTHNTFVGYLRETGYHVTDDDQYAYDLGNGHGSLILTGHGGRMGMIWEERFGEAEKARTEEKRREMIARLGQERALQIADASRILYVFPNLLFFDLEGLSIRQLEPTAAGVTDVRAWQYVPADEPPEVREIRLRLMVSFVGPGGLATPDDIEAYEAVQRGIEATAGEGQTDYDWSDMSRGMADEAAGRQGRSIDEGAMRSFWRHWARVLGEVPAR
jgi:benzoate/toluate 1,2-dioxygenase alpha subunit